jgi:parallel beta-helix repeat protein
LTRTLAVSAALIGAFLLLSSMASATTLPEKITESTTLTAAGSPYTGSSVTIEPGATVKVQPGVKLKLDSYLTVNGTLKVEGTAEEPVVFTSPNESTPRWSQLRLESGAGASVIDHAELKWGGGNGSAIRVNGSSPTITNSTIRNSYQMGIYVAGGGSPEIANNHLFANPSYSIYYDATGTQTGEVNIHDNLVEGGEYGIGAYITSTGSVVGKNLGGNTITGTTFSALYYKGPDIPGNITGNTLIGNSENVIRIKEGTVAHSQTWSDGGGKVRFEGLVTVASGQTLTITKGVYLLAPNMTVNGTLKVEGTAEEPVVFTSPNESTPRWSQLRLESGAGASVIDHAELKWGGGNGSAIRVNGSSPTITNSTIRNSYDYAIGVLGSGAPKIEWNRLHNNPNGIYYTGTGNLSAPNNAWGCANGPEPAGCGSSVTSNVKWEPAVQLPELNAQCRGGESQCGEGADPVSLATGQLFYSHRDLLLTNKSKMPLEFVRAYSSGSSVDTGLGPGWSQTGLSSATELSSGAVLILRQTAAKTSSTKPAKGHTKPPRASPAPSPRSKAPSS